MATEQKQDTVTFFNVQKSYPPGEQLTIGYTLDAELKRSTRDWVGLFRVGWSSSRDYYTFEWAPPLSNDNLKGEVSFAGRRLPPEDNHFYQFCYVTSDGRVRGASSPFQFLAVSLARVDDLELIEVGEESLMILQPRKKEEMEVVKLNTINEALRCEKEQLTKQMEQSKRDSDARLKEKNERIVELERELVSKQESEQRLLEKEQALNYELDATKKEVEQAKNKLEQVKNELDQRLNESLERERKLNEELAAAKNNTVLKISSLQQQLAEKDAENKSMKDENAALEAEISDLNGQFQIKNAQVEDLSQLASTRGEEKEEFAKEAEQLQGRLLEVQQIRADLIEENDLKQVEIDRLITRLDTKNDEIEQLHKEIEELKQEVACAQENLAELVGAGPNALVLHQPTAAPAERNEPPTQPPTKAEIVDKAAYDALLQAYESLEGDLKKSKETNRDLAKKQQLAEVRCEEMVTRLSQAKEKYQVLARENYELKKCAGGSPSPQPQIQGEKSLQKQIKEMESINKELLTSCDVASQELSARKEEMKQQQSRIEELETALAQARQELDDFRDKHDKIVHTKNESLDEQQAVLDQKLKEVVDLQQSKGKLENIIHQLRSQLASLKAAATTNDRTCPMCETKFPSRMSQEDYERHVQGHFN